MSDEFKEKVIIVTGASSGIGRDTAIEFAREGANVVVAARREEEGLKTVDLIKEIGGNSIFVQADVAHSNDVKAIVETAISHFGRLDFAFNNAGTAEPASNTVELSEEEFDRVYGVNVRGIWLCMKYQIPEIIKQGGGAIVNMSSVWGVLGTAMGVPAYVASKHAVLGLSKAAALEFGHQNVRVNSISPAWVPTEGNEPVLSDDEARGAILSQHPIGRLGSTMDVANAVKWMCSDGASWYTAQNMIMDGGYSAQ